MLSVLIETHNDEERLVRTLATLVSGAVQGLVREVVIRDLGSTDGTARVAEHAGCTVSNADLATVIDGLRGEWLLLLEPGARLHEGWTDAARDHVSSNAGAGRFTRRTRVWMDLLRRPSLRDGLLIAKRDALAIGASDAAMVARRVRARRIGAEISAAG